MSTQEKTQEMKDFVSEKLLAFAGQVDETKASNEFKNLLKLQSKMSSYSLGNIFFAWAQWLERQFENRDLPDLSVLNPYGKWKELGRQVKKGEKGLMIFAPQTQRIYLDSEEKGCQFTKNGKPFKVIVNGFRIAYTFDVSQTDGDPLPEPPKQNNDEDASELFDKLLNFCDKKGIKVEFDACLDPSLSGYSTGGAIVLNGRLQGSEKFKVLIHEVAHELLHWGEDRLENNHSKTYKETEAESVAFIVGSTFGLDMSQSKFYVASYKGDGDLIQKSFSNITKASKEILDHIQ